jgi:hypothetical protein
MPSSRTERTDPFVVVHSASAVTSRVEPSDQVAVAVNVVVSPGGSEAGPAIVSFVTVGRRGTAGPGGGGVVVVVVVVGRTGVALSHAAARQANAAKAVRIGRRQTSGMSSSSGLVLTESTPEPG